MDPYQFPVEGTEGGGEYEGIRRKEGRGREWCAGIV